MKILVTGATGNVGRLVVDELLRAGATEVRALTTNPAKAALPPQVEVVKGYLGRPESLTAALRGVDRMYLAPLPHTVREVVAMAQEAGVRYVVDLAGAEDTGWHSVEEALEDSALAWTHVEAGEFMTNYRLWGRHLREYGEIRDTCPNSVNTPIAMEDIAAVVATLLLAEGHAGMTYVLTGPEALTRAQMVRVVGAAIGRDVRYVELPMPEAVEELRKDLGDYAPLYVEGLSALEHVSLRPELTVQRLTGRPGMTFADWVRRHIDYFRPAEAARQAGWHQDGGRAETTRS